MSERPRTMTAEREAEIREHHKTFDGPQAIDMLFRELDAERLAHTQEHDRFISHLRCMEAILGQIDQIPVIDNEDDLVDFNEQSASIAVDRIRAAHDSSEQTIRELREKLKRAADALRLAMNTVECASVDRKIGSATQGEELPWYKAAKRVIAEVGNA